MNWLRPLSDTPLSVIALRLDLIGGRWHASVSSREDQAFEHADAQSPEEAITAAMRCLEYRVRYSKDYPEIRTKNVRNELLKLERALTTAARTLGEILS